MRIHPVSYVLALAILTLTSLKAQAQAIVNNSMLHQVMSGTYASDVHVYPDNLVMTNPSSVVRMATNTKIIVHPGGTLIIGDGSTITHANDNLAGTCTDLWHGIIVLGDPTQSQEQEQRIFCRGRFEICGPEGAGVGGGPECVGVHPQGVVYSDGGQIRNANVAVSVGDELNPYEYGAKFYAALGNRSGGYVYLKNCTFRNNKRVAISFAPYPGFDQHSLVQNNTFLTNFYPASPVFLDAKEESFIRSAMNRFKFSISGNTFSCPHFHNAGYWMNGAIIAMETNGTITNNTFYHSFHGSCINAYSFNGGTSGLKITNNTIYDNQMGAVRLYAMDMVDMKSNTIYYSSPATHSYGGSTVFLSECINTSIRSNSIVNNKAGNYKNEGGIGISNQFNRSNVIRNNMVNGMVYGFNVMGRNLGTLLPCNTFYSSVKSDLNHWPGSQTGNQGALYYPSGNIFSNTGAPGYKSIQNDGSHFYYYYAPGSYTNPATVTNVTKRASAINGTCSYASYSPLSPPPCGVLVWTGWGEGSGGLWSEYYRLRPDNVEQDPDYFPEEGSLELTAMRNTALADIANLYSWAYFFSDTVVNPQFADSLVQFLYNDSSFNALCILAQWYIEIGDLASASNVIDDIDSWYIMSEAQDFVEYMNYMVAFADSNYAVSWLTTNYDAIETIALDSGHYMYAKARVLCNLAAASDSTHLEYGKEVFFLGPDSNSQMQSIQVNLNCYPNPFTTALIAAVTNTTGVSDSLTVELVNFSATVYGSQTIFLNASSSMNVVFTSLGSLPSGFYIVRVLLNGSMIKSAIVQK